MIYVRGLQGLGDQIHQRPYIRAACERDEVWLQTPWPELYGDLPVRCVRWDSRLRTQAKNERATAYEWHAAPGSHTHVMTYGSESVRRGSIHDALEQCLPLAAGQRWRYDLPWYGPVLVPNGRRVAVVRPVTLRSEWDARARNCRPEYVAEAAQQLLAAGWWVVSVGDFEQGREWADEPLPPASQQYHRGELGVEQLLGLVQHADLVATPIGWALHAAVASRVPVVCIAGGRGQHNAPWKEHDPRQDLSRVRWLMPDRYCMCEQASHDCNKEISDFGARFARALDSLERA